MSSSNLGHNIPGVSNNSISLLILIHSKCLVIPGLLPTFVAFLPTNVLIKVDFPTLGIPKISILTFLSLSPFSFLLSFNSLFTSSVTLNISNIFFFY